MAAVPELRIVDDELWQAVKARQASCPAVGRDGQGNVLNRAHRRRYLLSGLMRLRGLRRRLLTISLDRYGCAAHRNKGTCGNERTIRREAIEDRGAERPEAPAAGAGPVRAVRGARSPGGVQQPARRRPAQGWRLGAAARRGRAPDRGDRSGRSRTASTSPRMKDADGGAGGREGAGSEAELARQPSRAGAAAPEPAGDLPARRSRSCERLLADAELAQEAMEAIRALIERDRADAAEEGGMDDRAARAIWRAILASGAPNARTPAAERRAFC